MATNLLHQRPIVNRWTAFDGLRGIMAIFVFLAHVDYDVFSGPVIFMDTFFILSSFLITRLLLKDWSEHKRINFKAFYIRRAKRLFPALLAVTVATTAVTYFYWGRGFSQMLHVAAALFYFTNWIRAFEIPHDYYLGHTWSLSIEEQYYLIWPVLLALSLNRGWYGKKLTYWLVAVACISAAWRAYLAINGASIHRTYNGTDVRLDSLALGAILAINLESPWMEKLSQIFSKTWMIWLLIITLLVGMFAVDFREMKWHVWQQAFYELISLALIIGLLQNPQQLGLRAVFQNRVIVYLGTICYGIYLWHYPILLVGEQIFKFEPLLRALLCGALTIMLASLSYFLLERPVLRSKVGSSQTQDSGLASGLRS
ncbi:acyltransferase family protein [Undibacterium terreum]|uniref:acyltransferase family protein n=1 Tax=Undibacterium terreum TaxID=1224302 RepID=UPI00166AD7EE|nr:acyltransferase [Undibacterium terreum]